MVVKLQFFIFLKKTSFLYIFFSLYLVFNYFTFDLFINISFLIFIF
jgi:hypothetical protein